MTDTRRFAVKLRAPDGVAWREFFCEAVDATDAQELAEDAERNFVRAQADAIAAASAETDPDERAAILAAAGVPANRPDLIEDKAGARRYLRDNVYAVESVTAE
jgi:hypothetical protein